MRFRVHADPKQSASLVVEEAKPVRTTYALTNIDSGQMALFISQKSIDKTVEDALRKILAQKQVVAAIDEKKDALDTGSGKIFDDQQRIRENTKALKGTAEEEALVQRYAKQLNEEEDRLDALKKEIAQLEGQQTAAQAALDKMIQELALDVKI